MSEFIVDTALFYINIEAKHELIYSYYDIK